MDGLYTGLPSHSRLPAAAVLITQLSSVECWSRVHLWDQVFQGHDDTGERSKPRRLHSWAERQGKGCLHLLNSNLGGGGIRRIAPFGAVDPGGQVSGIKGYLSL